MLPPLSGGKAGRHVFSAPCTTALAPCAHPSVGTCREAYLRAVTAAARDRMPGSGWHHPSGWAAIQRSRCCAARQRAATVHRALLSVTELDERTRSTNKRMEMHANTYLRSVRPGTVADPEALKQLRTEQRTAMALVDKKIQLLSEAHDLVEKHVERLTAEIARYDVAAGIPVGREHEIGASTIGQIWEEPMYCTCGRPSFGDMVGCDNPDCAIEWFHFECVGIHASPTGEWLCSVCSTLAEAKATAAAAARKYPASAGLGGRGPGSRGGRGGARRARPWWERRPGQPRRQGPQQARPPRGRQRRRRRRWRRWRRRSRRRQRQCLA